MDNAPRRSGHARVPNPKFYGADNAAAAVLPKYANALDVAAAAAHGTSITSSASPIQAADRVTTARKVAAISEASLARSAATDEDRQLALAEILAAAAPAASGTLKASQASPIHAAERVPIARKVATVSAALLACSAATAEVRQLTLAELLAVAAPAAPAAISRDPATYKEAMRGADAEEWTDTCHYEMDALSKNDTWELVELPAGRKAIKPKWVFKLKIDGRYRARVVAKGFTQIPDIDYDETFSPVACFESL